MIARRLPLEAYDFSAVALLAAAAKGVAGCVLGAAMLSTLGAAAAPLAIPLIGTSYFGLFVLASDAEHDALLPEPQACAGPAHTRCCVVSVATAHVRRARAAHAA
jgi:hypothetical protein